MPPSRSSTPIWGVALLGLAVVGLSIALAVALTGGPAGRPASTSASPIAVPDVVGLPMARALSAVEALGLRYRVRYAVSCDRQIAAGLAASQLPAPGVLVLRGSVVSATFSTASCH